MQICHKHTMNVVFLCIIKKVALIKVSDIGVPFNAQDTILQKSLKGVLECTKDTS